MRRKPEVECTYTFIFGVYRRGEKELEMIEMPAPVEPGWKKRRVMNANGIRLLSGVVRDFATSFAVRFAAASGGNELGYRIIEKGSCAWMHDMRHILCSDRANMPTVAVVMEWERELGAQHEGDTGLSSLKDIYGLRKQLYWPSGGRPYEHIKVGAKHGAK